MKYAPEFLLARIAEDEAVARVAIAENGGDLDSPGPKDWELHADDYYPTVDISPARVLAECEAKRLLVEYEAQWHDPLIPSFVLRVLVLPYADHPDYLPEWRP